jgi:primosomal protein N' (replication factor Y)
LVEVAVGAPVRGTFTYEAEDPLALSPGRRLLVPFGRRQAIGISLGAAAAAPEGRLRKVVQVLDDAPVFSEDLLALLRFAADHYLYPLGEALRGALPPDLGKVPQAPRAERAPGPDLATLLVGGLEAAEALRRAPKQLALVSHLEAVGGTAHLTELRRAVPDALPLLRRLEARGFVQLTTADRPQAAEPFSAATHPHLTPAQQAALEAISASAGAYATFLLLGVTGSGKTEVYLQAIEAIRREGKGALVLVPELALTPQLAGRFRSRFGAEVAVLHSGMNDRERTHEHRRLLHGEASIALGARSVVFAPVRELGMIVVDEEHDPSFKQEEKLRYHARDLAVVRARLLGIPCILGSATPSLESLENTRNGKYRLLELPTRVDGRAMPTVEVVDLGKEPLPPPGTSAPAGDRLAPLAPPDERPILGEKLGAALRETVARGEQAILFLNRRGHAPLVLCPTCGESASCTHCDVGLTYHRSREELRCHYCDLRVPRFSHCPSCNDELLVLRVGPERLEQSLAQTLPAARVLRLAQDAAPSGAKLTQILATFARREADVLVGTQMIAKGHDFPGVTLVGVVLADIGMGLPDFRAAERTFQLLTQVGGRAGRGSEPGRVILQTFHPEAAPVRYASQHDYRGFSEVELVRRKGLGYPPHRRMLAVRVDGEDPTRAERVVGELGRVARGFRPKDVLILGPAPAPLGRLRGRSRFQLLALAHRPGTLRALGERLLGALPPNLGGVRVAMDMDPVSML